MKLKNAFLSLMLMLLPVAAVADMTDQQIIQYITEQQEKGTEQSVMVKYLLSKGVSPQRLQQIRTKYEKMKGNGSAKSQNLNNRTRTAMSDGVSTPITNGRIMGVQHGSQLTAENPDFISMQGALEGFAPDSTAVYTLQPEGPKVFGRDMFRNPEISFEPNLNIATPSNYVLGPGDVVYIDVYGASQTTIEGTISPDGAIVVEDYGPLHIGGLTVEQATKRAKSKLNTIYKDSQIDLTVGQTRTIQVNVMGEALYPGTYTLSAFASIFHALYSAGGVSDLGSLRTIKLFRRNRLVATVDIYDYILNGKLSADVRLQDNDVIVIAPYDALVNVGGKAKRPMYYEMKTSETVGKVLEYAGGFASDAYTKSMRLFRKAGGEMQVFNIDDSNLQSLSIADGDSLGIDSVLLRYSNMVELKGAFFRPGMYQLGAQTNTVKSLVKYAEGCTEDAFVQHAVLHRLRSDRSLEVIQVNLEGILNGTVPDISLRNEDVLFVASQKEAKENQTLTIRGEVFEPGIYKFAHNTTLEDLVLQAGGLKESASTVNVRVLRRVRDSKATSADQARMQTYTFDLKDGFVVDGQSGFYLEPFDEVIVNRSPIYMEQQSVSLEGEVMLPGTYMLRTTNTRISEVLEMAGGFTSEAAQNGVYVLRQMDEDEMRRRQNLLDDLRYNSAFNTTMRSSQMQGIITLPISDSLLVEREMRNDFYKVAVDMASVLKRPGSDIDLVLRDGDRIVVEKQKNTVILSGSVPYKSTVPYVKGKTLKYYLRQGGIRPTRRNLKMSYSIGPNGQGHAYTRNYQIEPGSEIFLREATSELNSTQKVSIFISAASTLATVAAVIISVLK